MFPKNIREIGNGRYELESEYEKIPDEECHEFDDILTKQRTWICYIGILGKKYCCKKAFQTYDKNSPCY